MRSRETSPIPRLRQKALIRPPHVSACVYSDRWKLTAKNVAPLFTATETIPAEYAIPVSTKHSLVGPMWLAWIKNGEVRLAPTVAMHMTANTATMYFFSLNTALMQKKKGKVCSGSAMAAVQPTAFASASQLSTGTTITPKLHVVSNI